jgi:hypothetical protein
MLELPFFLFINFFLGLLFSHFLFRFLLSFDAVLLLKHGALTSEVVHVFILQTNIMLTNLALLGLTTTIANMPIIIFKLDDLLTEFARFGAHHALPLVRLVFSFAEFYLTVLANNFSVSFPLMVLFIGLSYSLTTLRASVIHFSAADLMHSEL